jgi:hypothetical protein
MDISDLPFPASLFFRYFWFLAIAMTCFNAFVLRARSQKYIQEDPSLEEGYEKLFRGYLIYLNLPWIAMSIGSVFGGVKSIFDFMDVRSSNPFIWLFLVTVMTLWILDFVWVTFLGGAEFLINHPGVIKPSIKSPLLLKIFNLFSLTGGVLGLVFFSTMNW